MLTEQFLEQLQLLPALMVMLIDVMMFAMFQMIMLTMKLRRVSCQLTAVLLTTA